MKSTDELAAGRPATLKLKFTRNTCVNGQDVGPDYETDTIDVETPVALGFIERGRAVQVTEQPATEKKTNVKK